MIEPLEDPGGRFLTWAKEVTDRLQDSQVERLRIKLEEAYKLGRRMARRELDAGIQPGCCRCGVPSIMRLPYCEEHNPQRKPVPSASADSDQKILEGGTNMRTTGEKPGLGEIPGSRPKEKASEAGNAPATGAERGSKPRSVNAVVGGPAGDGSGRPRGSLNCVEPEAARDLQRASEAVRCACNCAECVAGRHDSHCDPRPRTNDAVPDEKSDQAKWYVKARVYGAIAAEYQRALTKIRDGIGVTASHVTAREALDWRHSENGGVPRKAVDEIGALLGGAQRTNDARPDLLGVALSTIEAFKPLVVAARALLAHSEAGFGNHRVSSMRIQALADALSGIPEVKP